MNITRIVPSMATALGLVACTTALAQESTYDVKVVCGVEQAGEVVAPGNYWTAINILNPGDETVKVEARVATALPRFTMGPLSAPQGAPLRPDHAFELDCPTLLEMAGGPEFLKGYAIVRSTSPVTIVAVYTQAELEGRATSIHTERVAPRPDAGCPDLTVREIRRPRWDAANRRSVIDAVIGNIGTADAPSTLARLIDPSTLQPTGAPFNSVVPSGPIAAGADVVVTFTLPYWVFNPDADLEVTADYKDTLKECNENNNVAEYSALG